MKNESSPILQNLHLLIDPDASAAVVSPIAAMIQKLLAENGITPDDDEYSFGRLLRTLSHFQEHCGTPASLPFVGEPWLVRRSIYCELVLTEYARKYFRELRDPHIMSGHRINKGEMKHELWLLDASADTVTVLVPPSPTIPLRVFTLQKVGDPEKSTGDITAAIRALNTPSTKKEVVAPDLLAIHSSDPQALVRRSVMGGKIFATNIGYLGRSGSLASARIIPQQQASLVHALDAFHSVLTQFEPRPLRDIGFVIAKGVLTPTKAGIPMPIEAVTTEIESSLIDLCEHTYVLKQYCRNNFIALRPEDCQRIYEAANQNPLLVCAALMETVSTFTQPETAAAIRKALINSIMRSRLDLSMLPEKINDLTSERLPGPLSKKMNTCTFAVLTEHHRRNITVTFPNTGVRRKRTYVAVSSPTQSFLLGLYDNAAMGHKNPLATEIIPSIYRLSYESNTPTCTVNVADLCMEIPDDRLTALENAMVGAKEVILTHRGTVNCEKLASANPKSTRSQSLFDHVVHTQDVCTALSLLGEFFAVDRKSIQVVSSKEDLVEQTKRQSIRNAFS